MTINKFLGGVALAALLAGAAQAQTTSIDATSDFDAQTIASEIGATLSGDVVLDFALDGVFAAMGAGGAVQVDFTLTNATFSSTVPTGAWTAATDPNCDFGAPTLGGGAGGSTVRFENTAQLNLCTTPVDADDGTITLPISVTTNGSPVSINVAFTPTADAGSYTGSDEDIDLADFAQAFTFSIDAGAAGSGLFDATGDDLTGSGTIGTLSLAAFPAGIEIDAAGTALATAQQVAASGSLVLTFPGGETGIDEANVDLGGVACSQAANVFTCAVTGVQLDAIDNGAPGLDITIDDDGDPLTVITVQTPTVVYTTTGSGSNTVSGATGNTAELEIDDGLDVNSLAAANFAWVRFGTGGTESNFRAQFASDAEAAAVNEVRVTTAAGNGVSAQTVTLLPDTADLGFQVLGSTVVFNSRALGAASGETGNADITDVEVQHDEIALAALDANAAPIHRQLVNRSPGSYVATPGLESDN